jgi:hypothetical protein
MLSLGVEDEGNICRMFGGEADEDALTCLGVPLRDCLAILQFGVEDVDWATKNMRAREMGFVALDTRPEFLG